MNSFLRDALADVQARKNISSLREFIKQPQNKMGVQQDVAQHMPTCMALLGHADAKTRKNMALLLGDLAVEGAVEPLWQAYQAETQLFVKSAYLTALQAFDCTALLSQLQERRVALQNTPRTPETDKHLSAELQALSALLLQMEPPAPHTFTGYEQMLDCVLLTNRLHAQVTADAIQHGEILPFPTGVRVRTDKLSEILSLRTYREWLLVIPDCTTLPANPVQMAQTLAKSQLLPLLSGIHAQDAPFRYRVEMKTALSVAEKSEFIRKFTGALAVESNYALVNTPSHYELELRLIANTKGSYHVLVKLFTLPDTRFAYRKHAVATSMRPELVALLVQLAQPYMKPKARVLDPFCGVGTMLIERHKRVGNNTAYGIDHDAETIAMARENTQLAGQIVHYINKNCLHFTHEHLFDEIFTQMPATDQNMSQRELQDLYYDFFRCAKTWLTAEGMLFVYTDKPWLVDDLQNVCKFAIVEAIPVLHKQDTWFFILQYRA